MDTAVTNGQLVPINDSRESEVNSLAEMIISRAAIGQTVDELTPDYVLEREPGKKSLGDYFASLDSVHLNPFQVYDPRDKAIKRLGKNLDVVTTKKSTVVSVSNEADDPHTAQAVLEALLTVVQAEHLEANRTKGSLAFFESQAAEEKQKLEAFQNQLKTLKTESGFSSFEQQRQIHLAQLGAMESGLALAQADVNSVEAEVAARQKALGQLPDRIEISETTGLTNTPEFDMRTELFKLEVEEKRLASALSDATPQLIRIREQIKRAQQTISEESQKKQKVFGLSATRELLKQALLEKQAVAAGLQSRVGTLHTQIADSRSKLLDMNQKEVELASLQRDIDLAAANYKKYAESRETARIDQEQERASISSLNLVQTPTFSRTPATPKIPLVLGGGGVLGLFSALGVALLFERRRATWTRRAAPAPAIQPEETTPPPRTRRLETAVPSNPR